MPTFNSTRARRARTAIAALLMSTALVGGGYAIGHAADTPAPANAPLAAPNTATQPGFADLVDHVKHAVVNISTTQKVERQQSDEMPFPPGSPFAELFKRFQQQQGNQDESQARHALGSGFVIDPSGYIVTNNHVVGKADKITVTLDDGTNYPATVKGRDEKTDVALLKIDAHKPLPYVQFGDSDQARVGDWVIAVGNPFGLGGTVTAGIVSANGRDIHSGPYDDFLQVDAPINPGNSGGPLFDQSGHVLGIDTAIFSPNGGGNVGIGFAIPANQAKSVIAQLKDHGSVSRGWLGVQMQPLTPGLAKAIGRSDNNGVLVDEVQPNSPAEKAQLKQGDVITAFDKKPIARPRDLAQAVADAKAGASVPVTVWRDGHERTVDVTIQNQKPEQTASNADRSEGPRVGMALAPLSQDARDALGLSGDTHGVVVSRVTPDSLAADSGLRAGDVIVSIGNDTVNTPKQAATKISEAQKAKKDAVPLLVMRDGAKYYVALQLANG
ncbi:MAG TPA: DegQ family serine endoprotease [Alphaproteobacteria bacterium]|nr:DegQ family serine endoprotease [Alphaproteobacteria bacterium]